MEEKQKTIKEAISVSGIGLHTGKQVKLTFKPAPANHGYKFKRVDLENTPLINADVDFVVDTTRGTSLEHNGIRITTVEHVLAAVAGLNIDNILIELDCSETPIMDGSSKYYVEALLKAGIQEQNSEKKYFGLNSNISYSNSEKKVEMLVIPNEHYKISTMIDYDMKVLGTQNATLNKIEDFKDEIASCRTFVFLHELEYLFTKDHLIKGGDLNNAIVFVDRVVSQKELDRLATIFNKPKMSIRKEGILNNLELYFPNEPARHKLLDIVGDLALIGMPIKGHVIAYRPGHSTNIEFAKLIKAKIKEEKAKSKIPHYDPNKEPIYNINQIKKILPHRPPFLLIDRITEMSDKHVVGIKNVTMNESFFVGHFPDEPVMPGVLQIEAMAQAGGIFSLNNVSDPENYSTYFLKIDNVRFRKKVVPGDTLIFKLVMASPFRRGICHMKGIGYVGNKIVIEAELIAQIVKDRNK